MKTTAESGLKQSVWDEHMTKDEAKRQEIFDGITEEFTANGYELKDLTTTALKANVIGPLIGAVLSVPFIAAFFLLGHNLKSATEFEFFWIVLSGLLIVSIVVHEIIHGITMGIFAKNHFKSIAFGIIVQYLTPYCSCKEPLRKHQYILGLLMPCIVLGIIPMILALAFGSFLLLVYGAFMTITAGGDLLIMSMILKSSYKGDVYFVDHPTKIGLAVFVKE